MIKHANAILKLSLALGALLAGSGIGFYYGIYLPSRDIRLKSEEITRHVEQRHQQTNELAQKAKAEEAAQNSYSDCIASAQLTYKSHWSAACRAQHTADVAAYEDCADNLFATEAGCHRKHPIRPAHGCALTTQMADRLTNERKDARQECHAALLRAQQAPDETRGESDAG